MRKYDLALFEQVLRWTRHYFVFAYHGGTREMIYRHVFLKMGDVDPVLISAALKVMKLNAEIAYDKKVWWGINVK